MKLCTQSMEIYFAFKANCRQMYICRHKIAYLTKFTFLKKKLLIIFPLFPLNMSTYIQNFPT